MQKEHLNTIHKVVLESKERGTHDLQTSFSIARGNAESTGSKDLSRCLYMLSSVFSMYFQFKPDAPFGPMFTTTNGRSFLPEDLTNEDLNLLEETGSASNDPVFTSRIYDVLWLRKHDHRHARKAVDAYLRASQSKVHWVESIEFLKRAAQIASQIGRNSEEKKTVSAFVLSEFGGWESRCFDAESDYRPFKYVKIMLDEELIIPDWEDIGNRCQNISAGFPNQPFCVAPRDYQEIAAKCFTRAGMRAKADEMMRIRAHHFLDEAKQFQEVGNGFLASDRYKQAIRAFSDLGMSEEVEKLAAPLKQANIAMLGQMKSIEVPMNSQPQIERAKQLMRGKIGMDAIVAFMSLNELLSYKKEFKNAQNLSEEHPLQAAIGAVFVEPEGNISAAAPSIFEDEEASLSAKVMQNYNLIHNLIGSTWINAGRQSIIEDESGAWVGATEELLKQSHFCPDDRQDIYLKGLSAGMNGDGLIFLHLIIPQLENSLRYVASIAGIKVTSLKKSGSIQREVDVDALLRNTEVEQLIGEDLAWELRSILTEPIGPHLRHRVCHGLPVSYQQPVVCYLLWLVFFALFKFKKTAA